MTNVWLFIDGGQAAEKRWSQVPRVGEVIVLAGEPHGTFKVSELVWQERGDELVARVHLVSHVPRG